MKQVEFSAVVRDHPHLGSFDPGIEVINQSDCYSFQLCLIYSCCLSYGISGEIVLIGVLAIGYFISGTSDE